MDAGYPQTSCNYTTLLLEQVIQLFPESYHTTKCKECISNSDKSGYDWSWVPLAICISLKEREDRTETVTKEFHRVGLCDKVVFYRPSKDKTKIKRPGTRGCWESHRSVASTALSLGLQHVLIFEDDVIFDDTFTPSRSRELVSTFKTLPKKWNIFFLGHSSIMSFPYKKNIIRTWSLAAHAYAISRKQMKYIIRKAYDKNVINKVSSIDYDLANIFTRKSSYAFYPMIAYQDVESPSDNQTPFGGKSKRIVNWVIDPNTMKKNQDRSFWILLILVSVISLSSIATSVGIYRTIVKRFRASQNNKACNV